MHSVGDVQAAFARHGERLALFERSRASALLLPAAVVRAWRRTPALGSPAKAAYFVVVVTDRRRLDDLHVRLPRFATRRDNVFVVYRRGAPRNVARMQRILDDVES